MLNLTNAWRERCIRRRSPRPSFTLSAIVAITAIIWKPLIATIAELFFSAIATIAAIIAIIWTPAFSVKAGFHIIATIATIAEKKKVSDRDRSDHISGNHSPAITAIVAKATISGCTALPTAKYRNSLLWKISRTQNL